MENQSATHSNVMQKLKRHQILLIFALLIIALVALPRFNRGELLGLTGSGAIGGAGTASMGDASWYVTYVEYFRGEAQLEEVMVPFRYRPLVPLIASVVPSSDEMTAINVVNLIALLVTVLLIYIWLGHLGYSSDQAVVGALLWGISFPTFYYATDGYVDAVGMAFLALGLLSVYRGWWWSLAISVIAGSLVKEIVVLLVPTAMVLLWVRQKKWWWLAGLLLIAAYLVPVSVIRALVDSGAGYIWKPSIERFESNLRFRAFASIGLTFGLPGLLALLRIVRFDRSNISEVQHIFYPMVTGLVFAFGLTGFAFATAYADGRFMWPATVFCLPLALDALQRIRGGNRPRKKP